MRLARILVAAGLLVSACGDGGGAAPIGPGPTVPPETVPTVDVIEPASPLLGLQATRLVSGLEPLTQAVSPIGDERVFAVEKRGQVHVWSDGGFEDVPFLDIEAGVLSEGSEQGLLTMAFHPHFRGNGRVFVAYTDLEGDLQIDEFRVADDPDRLDPLSQREVMSVSQPHQYHQSGSMVFGPNGYLWLSLGDGGGTEDPNGNAQSPQTLKGSVVRVDVDAAEPYAVPPDNPFVDQRPDSTEARSEVWAYGLRNPWRLTIDAETGLLYIPDVGQYDYEEVNIVSLSDGGNNYGWPVTEGPECVGEEPCDTSGFQLPTFEYEHDGACAIVGGPVYRGATIPELHGSYFYADYCLGWIRSFSYDPTTGVGDVVDWEDDLGRLGNISSLDVDGQGEILVSNLAGEIWRIDAVR